MSRANQPACPWCASRASDRRFALGKTRSLRHQMIHDLPAQCLCHGVAPNLVGMAQGVPVRRRGPSNRCQGVPMHLQRITHVAQPNRVGNLRMHQRHHMTPRHERSASFVHPVILRHVRYHVPTMCLPCAPESSCTPVSESCTNALLKCLVDALSSLPSGRFQQYITALSSNPCGMTVIRKR